MTEPDEEDYTPQLPVPLRGQITDVRRMSVRSGQAHLFRGRWHDGRHVVLKVFHHAHDSAEELWAAWSGADRRYLAPLVFCTTFGGRDFEVTEFLPAGSLDDHVRRHPGPMPADTALTVLREVATGLHYLHQLPARLPNAGRYLVHGDVKPGNILVRSDNPLELCVTDLGIARITTYTFEEGPTSKDEAYAAPERFRNVWSPAGDWWSLGITLLQLLHGRHPLAEADGSRPNAFQINDLVNSTPIPLGQVPPRWDRLLRGLLTIDRRGRWEYEQIERWLAGEDPPVFEPEPAVRPAAGGPVADEPLGGPFVIDGATVRGPRELAEAMRANWTAAANLVIGWQRETLLTWAGSISDQLRTGLEPLTQLRPVDRAVTEVIVTLDVHGPATFRGYPVDAASLPDLAAAANQGDARLLAMVNSLHESDGLRILGRLAGNHDLFPIHDRWRHLCDVARTAAREALGSYEDLPARERLAGLLLQATLDPGFPDALADAARRVSVLSRQRVGWFRRLVEAATGDDAPAYDAVVLLSHPLADEYERRVGEAVHNEVRLQADQLFADLDAEIARGDSARTPAQRRRLRVQARAGGLFAGPRAGLIERLALRRPALAATAAYLFLVLVAGVGIAVGTSTSEGILAAGMLLLVGVALPVGARSANSRLRNLLFGGWAGALVGLVVASVLAVTVGALLGPTAAWPTFWVGWTVGTVAGAVLGVME